MKIIDRIKWWLRKACDQRFVIVVHYHDGTSRHLKWSEYHCHSHVKVQDLIVHNHPLAQFDGLPEHTPVLNFFHAELLAFRLNHFRTPSFAELVSYGVERIH